MALEQCEPRLVEYLRHLNEIARDKPNHKAWEKAKAYVEGQARKGFNSCTLPPYASESMANYVANRLSLEGVTVSVDGNKGDYLLYTEW